MTARKYVVSKRGVKREVRSPRLTARERLLQYVGGDGSVDYMGEDARVLLVAALCAGVTA